MSGEAIRRLARSIGYPMEEIGDGVLSHDFSVDGFEVTVGEVTKEDSENPVRRLRFSIVLQSTGENAADLAKYALGRMLKESAVLAFDQEKKTIFLWDEVETSLRDAELVGRFGEFLDSCDWWRERVKELEEKPVRIEEMVIRP